jgi:NAD+ synthase
VSAKALGPQVLELDLAAEVDRICAWMVEAVAKKLHRRGVIIAMSGGIDSSVCAALAARAFGTGKVFGILLPERDSSHKSADRGALVADHLGLTYELQDIAPALAAIGCYRQRDEAIRRIVPQYADDWKCKIAISGGATGGINFFKLIVQSPSGEVREERMPLKEYLQVVAATNHKQRIRKTVEYYHADRLNYAVIGTPNRLEYDQGFFVKNGDGAADIKPIAHLYKSQVYMLARHLGLPEEVCSAAPTTDTYSLAQGQDEFYFPLPYHQMDIALWAKNHGRPASELATALGITEQHAGFIYNDIDAKRRTTHYLHARPILVDPVTEVAG